MSWSRALTGVVAAAALLAAACTPTVPDETGPGTDPGEKKSTERSKLVIGTTADVVNFNPLVGNSRTDLIVTNLMYPRLMQMDRTGTKSPLAATEWGYEDGGRTAWMTLRDDLTWSDGTPFTAEDVAFTVSAIWKEKIGVYAGLIPSFKKATAVSDTRVEFDLSRPDGTFLTSLGFWVPIVPAHVFGKAESVQDFPNTEDWVSAGPYKLTSVKKGESYQLEAVDSYPFAPGGKPTLDEVEFRVYPDVNTEVLALRSGELDIISNAIPPAQAKSLQDVEGVSLQEVPSLGYAHVQYNTKRKPLNRVEVRRALAKTIDAAAIRRVVLQGQAKSTGSSVVTPTLDFWHDPSLKEYAYDPGAARAELEKAGFEDGDGDGLLDGLQPTLIYDKADPILASLSQLVRDSSREAGIDVKLSGLERNTYGEKTAERDFDIYVGSWAIMEDPPAYLGLAFRSGGFINYGQVTDPTLDALIDRAQKATTPEEAREPVHQIARRVHDQVYDVVLYVQTFNIAHDSSWGNFVVQPSELLSIINPQSLAQVRQRD
ncbi:ABC transporter substrate-binding protein [Actinopolymorpha sp. B9G3]|uniref:ABC transporter substrate-binding protein n=1 Tax=Actinopolymorpha sp. B9G3 TaxID=3158970 RepID=UPI0032D90087